MRFPGLVAIVRDCQYIFAARNGHEPLGIIILVDTPSYVIPPTHGETRTVTSHNIGIPRA